MGDGVPVQAGVLNATTQTIAWCVIFFFASAGASAAYLTVSEIFPMETRAMAIAFFYAIGTLVGGATGPLLFGKLVETEKETAVFWGFVLGATMMIVGGVIQAIWGVKAEQRSLEDVALPVGRGGGRRGRRRGRPDDARPRDGRRAGASRASPARSLAAGGDRGAGRRQGAFGPSQAQMTWSPQQLSVRSDVDTDIDEEVDELARVLGTARPADPQGARRARQLPPLGPGRFGRALRQGVLSGRIRRTGRDRYEAGAESKG